MIPGAEGHQSADDLIEAVTLDDAGAEPVAAVPSPEAQPTPAADAPPPDQTTETTDASPPADAGLAPATEPPKLTFSPPTGEPFTLRVDRNAIPLDGAVSTPDGGVYFSPDAWRKVSGSYVGDRHGWQQERRALEARAQQIETGRSQKEVQAEKALAKVHELFNNPEKLQAEFENWQVNGPRIMAEARAEAIQAERDQLAAEKQERMDAEEAARLIPGMQAWLQDEVEGLLAQPDFTGLFDTPQAHALIRELWEHHRAQFFIEDRNQMIHLRKDEVRDLVERRANYVRQARSGMQKVVATKAANTAALTPTKPGPAQASKPVPKVAPTPRDEETGKFTTDRKQLRRSALASLDDLTLDDALA
jgi:hypothetical protein